MPITANILTDPDVELAKREGGRLVLGRWTVRLPRSFGFCGGVLNALHLLQRTLEQQQVEGFNGSAVQQLADGSALPLTTHDSPLPPHPSRVLLLGDIIHYDTVNEQFRRHGVVILPDAEMPHALERIRDGDTVVIPAFGLERGFTAKLQALHDAGRIRLLDTTCRYVKRIWEFVGREAATGATVVIMGKPEHPENRATLSRALTPGNAVLQLANLEAVAGFATIVAPPATASRLASLETPSWIEEFENRKSKIENIPGLTIHNRERLNLNALAFAAQTTLLYSETVEAEQLLRETAAAVGAQFASAATVCLATQERQKAALDLCREGCDLFLVVGGFASSNTGQLYRLAAQHAPAYFIRTAADFDRARITHYDPITKSTRTTDGWLPPGSATIGLLSGASCPGGDIGGVLRKLRGLAGTVHG